MTLQDAPPVPVRAPASPQVDAPAPRVPLPARGAAGYAATSLAILGALLLGLVVQVLAISPVQHQRDQQVAYAQLREDLAAGTAPVGQTDALTGRLLALGTPVALMQIPAIGLRETVLEGTTSTVLREGPGHRRDTVLPGQPGVSVVFGRRAAYGGPFGSLADLRVGSTITVTTGQGRQDFRVTGVRRSGDPVPPFTPGRSRLTLVTAGGQPYVPSGQLLVDAELTSPVQAAPTRVLTSAQLDRAEGVMAGDRDAAYGLLLWAQGLLLAALVLTFLSVRWGRWQTWVVGVPVLVALGTGTADSVLRLLPNLL